MRSSTCCLWVMCGGLFDLTTNAVISPFENKSVRVNGSLYQKLTMAKTKANTEYSCYVELHIT